MADEGTVPGPTMTKRIVDGVVAFLRWRVVAAMLAITWACGLFGSDVVAAWIEAIAATAARWVEAIGVDGLKAIGQSIRIGG